jgi:bifunctional ADP-heptose synthase (sugar kinase/adenylyltransferase)
MPEKIKTREQLARIAVKLKKQGKKIVFANGCFDVLHVGHVRFLHF